MTMLAPRQAGLARASGQLVELVPGQACWLWIVDGGEVLRREHIEVDVKPERGGIDCGQSGGDCLRGPNGANLSVVEKEADVRANRYRAADGDFCRVARAEQGDAVRVHEGSQLVERRWG